MIESDSRLPYQLWQKGYSGKGSAFSSLRKAEDLSASIRRHFLGSTSRLRSLQLGLYLETEMLLLSSTHSILLCIISVQTLTALAVSSIIPAPAKIQEISSRSPNDLSLSVIGHDLPRPQPLSKRALVENIDLGRDWYQFFEVFEPIMPTQPASVWFTQFYTKIIQHLSRGGAWSNLPPWPSLVIGYGNFRIDFHSTIGPITLPVIVNFAQLMADRSRSGFAGRFRCTYYHRTTGAAITIWLSIAAPRLYNSGTPQN